VGAGPISITTVLRLLCTCAYSVLIDRRGKLCRCMQCALAHDVEYRRLQRAPVLSAACSTSAPLEGGTRNATTLPD